MHRSEDRDAQIAEGRYIAGRIPGATFLELSGRDHLVFVGGQDAVVDAAREFVEKLERTSE